jgi:hypothetical protein
VAAEVREVDSNNVMAGGVTASAALQELTFALRPQDRSSGSSRNSQLLFAEQTKIIAWQLMYINLTI